MDGILCLPSPSRKCNINIARPNESKCFHYPHQHKHRQGNEVYDYCLAVYLKNTFKTEKKLLLDIISAKITFKKKVNKNSQRQFLWLIFYYNIIMQFRDDSVPTPFFLR